MWHAFALLQAWGRARGLVVPLPNLLAGLVIILSFCDVHQGHILPVVSAFAVSARNDMAADQVAGAPVFLIADRRTGREIRGVPRSVMQDADVAWPDMSDVEIPETVYPSRPGCRQQGGTT
jgi:hypothetical protein